MARLLVVLFSVALLTSSDIAAQSKRGSIQGAWQTVEVTLTGPAARTISHLQPNLTIITARHYSRLNIDAEGPRPMLTDVAKASADELRAVWGPFVGEAGTYELIDGSVITMHPLVAKNPAAMAPGALITYSYKLDGDTMWVTEQRNQDGPFANPVTVKATRVE